MIRSASIEAAHLNRKIDVARRAERQWGVAEMAAYKSTEAFHAVDAFFGGWSQPEFFAIGSWRDPVDLHDKSDHLVPSFLTG